MKPYQCPACRSTDLIPVARDLSATTKKSKRKNLVYECPNGHRTSEDQLGGYIPEKGMLD